MPRNNDANSTSRITSRFSMLASMCLIVAILYFAQEVLVPIALAMLLSFLLAPLVAGLERRRLGRVPSVLIVVIVCFAAIGTLGYVVGHQIFSLAENADQYKGNITAKAQRFSTKGGVIEKVTKTAEEVAHNVDKPTTEPATKPSEIAANEIAFRTNTAKTKSREDIGSHPDTQPTTQATTPIGKGILEAVGLTGGPWTKENPFPTAVIQPRPSPLRQLAEYLGVIIGPLGTAGIVIVFVIFMLLEREDLRDRMIRLIGAGQLTLTTQALDDASTRISRYLLAQAIVNGSYGATIALGLWLIGVFFGHGTSFPNVILWGILCSILRFIPYIGPWIASAFPLTISLAVYPGFTVFVAVVSLFVVIELISNNFMEPWLYGSSTGISTVAIIAAAVFWTWLWGPIGLLLSTPLTVVVVVMGKYIPQLRFLDILLGDEAPLTPSARVYQRLLALDQEEAMELVREIQQTSSLEQMYDDVLLPALAMAEQDRHKGNLDDKRQVFIHQAMRDIVDELGDEQHAVEVKQSAAAVEAAAKGDAPLPKADAPAATKLAASAMAGPSPEEMLPQNCTINVVCLPAHDEGDEIVNLMLVQLLERRGYCATSVSQSALASEMVAEIKKHDAEVVVVSALPPASVSHARYLCKRVNVATPEVKMAVGLWTFKGDVERARTRMTCTASVPIETALRPMLDQIHQLVAPLVAAATAAGASPLKSPPTPAAATS
jgi:predicted PurR-regulated permease PerM